jgi:hypothetical protein
MMYQQNEQEERRDASKAKRAPGGLRKAVSINMVWIVSQPFSFFRQWPGRDIDIAIVVKGIDVLNALGCVSRRVRTKMKPDFTTHDVRPP